MEPEFLLGSAPANELLAAIMAFYALSSCALAFGCVHLYRYYRTRARRSLVLGLLLAIGVPLLAYFGLLLEVNSLWSRVMQGTIVDPDLFQNHAKD